MQSFLGGVGTTRRPYPTDPSDAEWAVLAPLVPPPKPGGRPPKHSRRELFDALAYWLRAGGAWRPLLRMRPPWPVHPPRWPLTVTNGPVRPTKSHQARSRDRGVHFAEADRLRPAVRPH